MRKWIAGMFALGLVGAGLLGGCHRPQGALVPYPGGSLTYYSTEDQPKSVTVVDTRSDEVVFAMDIPVGKQLSMNFQADAGDDPVERPDLMRYEIWDIGTRYGRLRNTVTVPNANSRRVDMYLRNAPEYAEYPDDHQYRTDDDEDRPDWWSERGGVKPDDNGRTIYH